MSEKSKSAPKNYLPKGLKDRFSMEFHAHKPSNNPTETQQYLSDKAAKADYAMLVVDADCAHVLNRVLDAFFAITLNVPADLPNPQNFFGSNYARPLRNFSFLVDSLNDLAVLNAAKLPTRNFIAADLLELTRIVRDDKQLNTFPETFGVQIGRLNMRKYPKKNVDPTKRFFIDDQGKHFIPGFEKHSSFGTGDSHLISCRINGDFRFGKKLEPQKHYNVTSRRGDGRIGGNFEDCHGALHVVPKTTHLNMFTNDFF